MAKPTQTQMLIALIQALRIELIHTREKRCYATVPTAKGVETLAINSTQFSGYLVHCYYEKHGVIPSDHVVQNVMRMLNAQALYKGTEEAIFTRFGSIDKASYLDLGTADGEIVEIGPDGWQIVKRRVPRFWRPDAMWSLPFPQPGGSIQLLRSFANIADDTEWRCLVGWLVGVFQSKGAYPILNILGPQGSAKSTFTEMLLQITDPRKGKLRNPPRDERELAISASQSSVMGFNNLSHLSAQMSDAFCRLSTGGGLVTRKLYTDDVEITFELKRPIVLNSIHLVTTRSDFLDRSIIINLPRIPDNERIPEDTLWKRFDQAKPLILGGLLDAVSCAMKNLTRVTLDKYPRMADLARFVTAAEPALGWRQGTFVAAYKQNESGVHSVVLAGSELAVAVELYLKSKSFFKGSATTLLQQLRQRFKGFKSLPSSPEQLGSELNRLAPNLRHIGIDVGHQRGTTSERRRLIVIKKIVGHVIHDLKPKRQPTMVDVHVPVSFDLSEPGQSFKGEVTEWTL